MNVRLRDSPEFQPVIRFGIIVIHHTKCRNNTIEIGHLSSRPSENSEKEREVKSFETKVIIKATGICQTMHAFDAQK